MAYLIWKKINECGDHHNNQIKPFAKVQLSCFPGFPSALWRCT